MVKTMLHIIMAIALTATGIAGTADFAGRTLTAANAPANSAAANSGQSLAKPETGLWIIKWKQTPPAAFRQNSDILDEQGKFGITVARPKKGVNLKRWLAQLQSWPEIQYIQADQQVKAAANKSVVPNDPEFPKQTYLRQIHMENAWNHTEFWRTITIAIVDTGVDLQHPDLKDKLVPGANLVNPEKPPQDDNGHGTNVAGVIGAIANNKRGVAGIVWKTKIMPIKALEANGNGTEDKLGEGITYAVDHGAKIVVLSVGMNRDSAYMRDVIKYAEDHEVLLVAASGNESRDVKFPAAYPPVLAVGGIAPDNLVEPESNYGPELDVVAPWTVRTTALGGGYANNQGTSMAAPQVAGIAALLWSKYPDMEPYEIRNMIRQTAEDVAAKGWDPFTGYGLLRADRALNTPYRKDMYENNGTITLAKPLPVDSLLYGEFTGPDDADWFYVDVPYDGDLAIQLHAMNGVSAKVALSYYATATDRAKTYSDVLTKTIHIKAKKGRRYLKLNVSSPSAAKSFAYSLNAQFTIGADPFENNDRQYMAYTLPDSSADIVGTFDHTDDQDWYMVNVRESGILSMNVTTDTARMDLALTFSRKNEASFTKDWNQDGLEESIDSIDVTPGQYYIAVQNVISGDEKSLPVRGQYTLHISFSKKLLDPNEPNNKFYQAVATAPNTVYEGVIHQADDADWFMFRADGKKLMKTVLYDIPADRIMSMTLYDANQKQVAINVNTLGNTTLSFEKLLPKGTYYVRLTADEPFFSQYYHFKVTAHELTAGYKDIDNSWAKDAIVALRNKQILIGYADYTFRPDQGITRAEAVTAIVRAFKLKKDSTLVFNDVKSTHWASADISAAAKAGIISGYPDRTFRPNQKITRREMAVMIGAAMKLKGIHTGKAPFRDITANSWGADMLAEMKQKGWISGYADGSFMPNRPASRAEFAEMLNNVLK
ncbi:MAG TPA: S8 family serine peptidase [Bacilli bacterium]